MLGISPTARQASPTKRRRGQNTASQSSVLTSIGQCIDDDMRSFTNTHGAIMQTNYVSRDTYGMYKNYGSSAGPGPALMGADTLLGNDVYNGAGENLGTIKEFMIDMAGGRIGYAVLSFGGFLGMGDRLFAVPWQALKLDTANKRFTLNVSKDKLKSAPGFDKDHWPSMADATWATDIHTFYGVPRVYDSPASRTM
jgi:sporulation protein YlmC with PRC-barrel domain